MKRTSMGPESKGFATVGPMPLDPRTPVVVGVAQSLRKPDRADGQSEPVDMMVDVLRAAADDAGAPALLAKAGSVRVVDLLSWGYRNAPALVAERVGALGVPAAQLIQST